MIRKKYRKGDALSYAMGAFPTMELVDHRPELVEEVLVSSRFTEAEVIARLSAKGIAHRTDDKAINRLAPKGNIFMIGVFRPDFEPVEAGNHVLCDHISDMGNLGNICRTMLAMGVFDLVTIGTSCDLYDPKTVRASMGAIFHLRHSHYERLEDYEADFVTGTDRRCYAFMLSHAAKPLPEVNAPPLWSICFGNEGSGLPQRYADRAQAVIIPQSPFVDSLNLTTAVAIGLYHFTNGAPVLRQEAAHE